MSDIVDWDGMWLAAPAQLGTMKLPSLSHPFHLAADIVSKRRLRGCRATENDYDEVQAPAPAPLGTIKVLPPGHRVDQAVQIMFEGSWRDC